MAVWNICSVLFSGFDSYKAEMADVLTRTLAYCVVEVKII